MKPGTVNPHSGQLRFSSKTPGKRRGMACFHGHYRYVKPGWEAILTDSGLTPDEDWSTLEPGKKVSDSRVTNCFKIEHNDGECIYFKRYVYSKHKKMRYFLRPGKASTEVFGYRQLALIGIPSLEVIAFREHRCLGRLVSACIVTRGIQNSVDLEVFARETWNLMSARRKISVYREIRDQLFAQIKRAHTANFFHQDLHWRNLLVTENGNGGYQTIWIDCPRARYQRFRHHHGILVDLSTLARIAPVFLDTRTRLDALHKFFEDKKPWRLSKKWFREIGKHHSTDLPKPPVQPASRSRSENRK